MIYRIQDIATLISPASIIVLDARIEWLAIDSRKIIHPAHSLFFALSSARRDGHDFIKELYAKGVRNFVVKKGFDHAAFDQANFLEVDHVLSALQQIARHHREQFKKDSKGNPFTVIGITGSNGKTIVKEWLNQLLSMDHAVVRSPRSYNSQIGVPLSIWQINQQHDLGIFEAGISTTGEMETLESIIQPSIGVLTSFGDAHGEGFLDRHQKFTEKIKLFKGCGQTVFAIDGLDINEKALIQEQINAPFTWSRKEQATLEVIDQQITNDASLIRGLYQGREQAIRVPFTDPVSIDNAITCWSVMLMLGYAPETIAERMLLLEPVDMRMQLKSAINHCYLINDSYSNDISSLPLAIDFLQQKAGEAHRTLILSDILQAGMPETELYSQVASLLEGKKIHRLIGIGKHITEHRDLFSGMIPTTIFYADTEAFLQHATHHQFQQEYILLRGARIFEFERISQWLELQQHQTVMEINLSAMAYNLKCYQQKLRPDTKMMAMVKAFSYGSGTVEVARLLEFHQVDYLAVAYADEGVVLRKAGIRLPIMVMNADEASFDALLEYHLEPELYSLHMYRSFAQYLQKQALPAFPVHLKLNTGMNRLGFGMQEIELITGLLKKDQLMQVKSVFSHLAASESAALDDFTMHQATLFDEACTAIRSALGYDFIKHLSNTAAIFRNPDLQYGMVRLGIGLYGIDSAKDGSLHLQTVNTLKSTIAQIHVLNAGDTVGYGRKGVMTRPGRIATVRIGYADGFNRRLGNGRGSIYVRGRLAPVIGNICMDMTMIDITGIEGVEEGDQVEIFGPHVSVEQIAELSDTIPYEILTGISQRVKRVYVEE